MENLEIPKTCPTCKGTDVWWTNDEAFANEESIQAVELEGDEDE